MYQHGGRGAVDGRHRASILCRAVSTLSILDARCPQSQAPLIAAAPAQLIFSVIQIRKRISRHLLPLTSSFWEAACRINKQHIGVSAAPAGSSSRIFSDPARIRAVPSSLTRRAKFRSSLVQFDFATWTPCPYRTSPSAVFVANNLEAAGKTGHTIRVSHRCQVSRPTLFMSP